MKELIPTLLLCCMLMLAGCGGNGSYTAEDAGNAGAQMISLQEEDMRRLLALSPLEQVPCAGAYSSEDGTTTYLMVIEGASGILQDVLAERIETAEAHSAVRFRNADFSWETLMGTQEILSRYMLDLGLFECSIDTKANRVEIFAERYTDEMLEKIGKVVDVNQLNFSISDHGPEW